MEYNEKEKNEIVKKNFWKDKKNIAIVILSVLLFFSIGSSDDNSTNSYLRNQVSDLSTQVKALEEENNKLNTSLNEFNSVPNETEEYKNKIARLELQVNELENKNSELEKEITSVKEEKSKLLTSQTKSVASTKPESVESSTSNSYTVYVTKTGAKYHRDGCRYLSRSQIAKSKNDAIAQGYTPCSVCNP